MTGNIIINGTITCTPDDIEMVVERVAEHVRLTRLEAGCIKFDITQSDDDPCVFNVSECFVDRAAFDSHTARTRASIWWEKSKHIPRDMNILTE
ncbi:MAG: quinol monooxygenase YgiN [Paracoccaceae bacterium]|jgi:quinol monooxygenase YgiN